MVYLDEEDEKGLEQFRRRYGLEKSQAFKMLIRIGYHHPELYKEEVERMEGV